MGLLQFGLDFVGINFCNHQQQLRADEFKMPKLQQALSVVCYTDKNLHPKIRFTQMKYNILIETSMGGFNIMKLEETKLPIILDFYENGKTKFTLSGNTYTATKLTKLKIYTYEKNVDLEEFKQYCIQERIIERNLIDVYFGEECLQLLGTDFTEKFIGDFPFGYKMNSNKTVDSLSLFEQLQFDLNKINYEKSEEYDLLEERAKMYIRKFFGNDSHYIKDIDSISFLPPIIMSGVDPDYKYYFESGLKQFKKIITIIIEDIKLSSNYPVSTSPSNKPKSPPLTSPTIKTKKLIDGQNVQILIASPSDAIAERDSLLNSLETKFRRDEYESQCGKRIIVRGWEELASQSGYGQDLINEQILKKVDIVLAVFKHKLGTPTIDPSTGVKRSDSGTAEELLFAINNNTVPNAPLGMAYFFSEAPELSFDSVDFDNALDQWKKLKQFKKDIQCKILYKEYPSPDELLTIVCKDLSLNIRTHFT